MQIAIKIPILGESITDATLVRWYKKPGDIIKKDEIIAEIETDKISLEITAPENASINEIIVQEGEVANVGQVIALITGIAQPSQKIAATNQIASPAAEKLIMQQNLNKEVIVGTGKDGRITKQDVPKVLDHATGNLAPVVEPSSKPSLETHKTGVTRVKMSRIRQTIAANLKAMQNSAAILTTFNEVDMTEVMRMKKEHKDHFKQKHGVKLGFMSFFVKGSTIALQEFPILNAHIEADEIYYKHYYHIGVAVATEQGLVVPVIREANELSLAAIEQDIARLAKSCKDNKIKLDDLAGATFSITNGGIYGSMLSTPIMGKGQSGILGLHNIVKRPIVVEDEIVIRPIMYLALSYDHRLVDGKDAVQFLVRVKQLIEKPETLLFE